MSQLGFINLVYGVYRQALGMSNIEKLIKQATQTFSKPQAPAKFQESLSSLIQSASSLTLSDVYLDTEFVAAQNQYSGVSDMSNPVVYIPVFEDANILVSIFVLKSTSVIPLHDHPVMHGILKVLCGSVRIDSFSGPNDNIRKQKAGLCLPNELFYVEGTLYPEPIMARKNAPIILSEKDNCALLTPIQNNIHEVRSYKGPSAFLDILAPPYDSMLRGVGPRKCKYFIERDSLDGESLLSPVRHYPTFWTVSVPYRGPKIRVDRN